MPDVRREVSWALMPMLVTCLAAMGCEEPRQLLDGTSISLSPGWWYTGRWVLAVASGLLAVLLVLAAAADDEGGAAVFFLVLGVGLGWLAYPGMVSPDDRWESANAAARARAAKQQEGEEHDASPAGRAKLAHDKRQALVLKRDHQFTPLRDRHKSELKTYTKKLSKSLPAAGYATHEDLVRAGDEGIELQNLLKRAAILTVTVQWLEAKIQRTSVAIARLEQQEWELARRIELNQVTSEDEWQDIEKMIATAQAIIEEDTPTATTQDYAAAEATIFRRFNR